MATMIPLSDLDLDSFEERELSDRSNVAADIAAVIASGEACAIEWTSSQLQQAKKWNDDNGAPVTLSQLGRKTARTQKVRGGKQVEVERFKRELIVIRPA
jgi:hypothetical protein